MIEEETMGAGALRGHEAHELDRLTRGRPLTDDEIACYLADHQTPLRHATARVGDEIAEMLRDRLAAAREPVAPAALHTLNELVEELPADWLGTGSDGDAADREADDWQRRWNAALAAARREPYFAGGEPLEASSSGIHRDTAAGIGGARRDPEPVASADGEALDDLRAAWSEGVEEGPWFPAHRPGGPIVLDNKNGDSLFVSAEDATSLVNAFLQPAAIRGTEAADVEALIEDGHKWRAAEAEGHVATFTEDGYGLMHPPSCRSDLIGCWFNRYLADMSQPDEEPGRYQMTRVRNHAEYARLADSEPS
jgi:hypothetical protein